MSAPSPPSVDVRRAADRFCTRSDGIESRHSFSFGPHYDPGNTAHGLLVAHNEERLSPGAGFDPHPHRDMEVVTWVLEGSLAHTDSTGRSGVVVPGAVQRMSAGTGVLHSERNDENPLDSGRPQGTTRFVQAWVVPDERGLEPAYEQQDVAPLLEGGALVPVASGLPEHVGAAPVRLAQRAAALHVARLQPGQDVGLPEAPYLHVFVARGAVVLEGAGALEEGDAVRFTAAGGQRVTASEPAEVLVWEMHAGTG